MGEVTEAHINALGRAMERRKGFRQLLDDLTFQDDRDEAEVPEDEEWTPLQRECLADFAQAVLGVPDVSR